MEYNSIFKNRYIVSLIIFILSLSFLASGSFALQVLKDEEYINNSYLRKKRTISVAGTRGRILDAYGRVLAYNEKSYNIEFFREKNASSLRKQYTDSIIRVIDMIEAEGNEIEPVFAIQLNDKNEFVFEWGNISKEAAERREKLWRKNFYFSETATPEEIYYKMRERYKLPEELDNEKALKVLAVWQDSILSAYA
ncbi:MAG TPA: hypothetical protein PLZ84_04000, partial [Clostridia bacterium]|nr:hypothetical protein [Clostridia bacterium]